ncbi:MAG: flagellin [Oscillospiraceae bacterium]|jgi:flagellin|nr:flagellin [Oscillospiraceae bacterium]
MRIQNNVSALNAHRFYGINQTNATKSIAKLSSGYRINSAADDAAGLAISEKMRAQIRGLTMASKNTQDGISLIQTAEGGLQEIDNMLQRIRELVVYASNDTQENNNQGTGDRQKIKDEIDQLTQEIDSMTERVEFNKKKLINGDCGGNKDASITADLVQARNAYNASNIANQTEKVKLDDSDTLARDKVQEIKNIIAQDISSLVNTVNNAVAGTLTDTFTTSWNTTLYGNVNGIDLSSLAITGASATGLTAVGMVFADLSAALAAITTGNQDAIDAINELKDRLTQIDAKLGTTGTALDARAAANTVITGVDTAPGSDAHLAAAKTELYKAQEKYDAEPGGGALYFQVGANANQGIAISINSITTDKLGIGNGKGTSNLEITLDTGKGKLTAQLDTLDIALSYVTTERSKLGAVQNRMEYTANSLDISAENIQAAESRIRDVDMAKEMTNFTKQSILFQASTAMLAQANAFPQGVLQLLG